MGKAYQQNPQSHGAGSNSSGGEGSGSGVFCCERCSMGLSRLSKELSFRCVFVLILSLLLLVSGIFWLLPPRRVNITSFDASAVIKLRAGVQANFRLLKPVSWLIPDIKRLEYDIYEEIAVPNTEVAILSIHPRVASNLTDVTFGVLPNPIDVPITAVSLSVLRSSLIEVFLRQSNLTLTTSNSGQPSKFEILKFPGGITVIPFPSASIWPMPQVLFNFTLNNSISDILDNLEEFKDQLKLGLRLASYENLFVQLINANGSTTDSPVIVQASVVPVQGSLLPQRLKQLAQIISYPPKNLGLNNSVFGKVKSVRLSSYLKGTLNAIPPSPSPAPSSELSDYAPSISPVSQPAPSPSDSNCPYARSPKTGPHLSHPHGDSPSPAIYAHPPCSFLHCGPTVFPPESNPVPNLHPIGPPPKLPPDISLLPEVSSLAPSPLSVVTHLSKEIRLLGIFGILMFHLLCYQHW